MGTYLSISSLCTSLTRTACNHYFTKTKESVFTPRYLFCRFKHWGGGARRKQKNSNDILSVSMPICSMFHKEPPHSVPATEVAARRGGVVLLFFRPTLMNLCTETPLRNSFCCICSEYPFWFRATATGAKGRSATLLALFFPYL